MIAIEASNMRQQLDANEHSAVGWTDQHPLKPRPEIVDTEDIHLRNYDRECGYDLSLEVVDESGDAVYEQWYYLQPGQVQSELDVLPAGEYEVRATLDNLREEVLQCRVDAGHQHTVVVEVGNGAVSLTEGITA